MEWSTSKYCTYLHLQYSKPNQNFKVGHFQKLQCSPRVCREKKLHQITALTINFCILKFRNIQSLWTVETTNPDYYNFKQLHSEKSTIKKKHCGYSRWGKQFYGAVVVVGTFPGLRKFAWNCTRGKVMTEIIPCGRTL